MEQSLGVFAKTAQAKARPSTVQVAARARLGALYGALAGLAFALATWGMDGWTLASSHAALPWLKLAAGLLPVLALTTLAGWLSGRFNRLPLTVSAWAGSGALLAWLDGVLPFQGTMALLSWLDPTLYRMANYATHAGVETRALLAMATVGGLCGLVAMFFGYLIEEGRQATSIGGRLLPALLWVAVLAIAGTAVDGLMNHPLRQPIVVMDDVVALAIQHQATPLAPEVARDYHLGALAPIAELLARPRRIVLGDYDQLFENVVVLIDFDGTWVSCSMLYNQLSYCERL